MNALRFFGVLFIAVIITASPAFAEAESVQLPPHESLLPAGSEGKFKIRASKELSAKLSQGTPKQQPFATSFIAETIEGSTERPHFAIGASTRVSAKIGKKEVILLRFYARTISSVHESGSAMATVVFQETRAPHAKSLGRPFGPSQSWMRYDFPFIARKDYPEGDATIDFWLNTTGRKQILEIGGIELLRFPPGTEINNLPMTRASYVGGHPGAPWREEALTRIEELRKATFLVRVIDASGNPVPNAQVHGQMQRQAFRFGTAGPAELLVASSPDGKRYQETVRRLFNTWVFDNNLKWPRANNADNAKAVEGAYQWLAANGITNIRGHTLVWGSRKKTPSSVHNLEPVALRAAMKTRVQEAIAKHRGKVYVWDVVNEAVTENDLFEVAGWQTFPDIFRWARAADPDLKLAYNDFALHGDGQQARIDKVAFLKEHGAPLDVIGDQGHIYDTNLPSPKSLLSTWDRFGQYAPNLEVTELDVSSFDDQLQADYLRDFLIAAYSHPKMQAVVLWGFWEGSHWMADRGAHLFKKDWTPRQSAKVLEELIKKTWWTDVQTRTDANGEAQIRGFLGDYRVTASANGMQGEAAWVLAKGTGDQSGNLSISIRQKKP
jgi:endo-1,4-beta-xylanase